MATRWIWPSESHGQGQGRNPMMDGHEKSDEPVVPANRRNKPPQGAADGGEERGSAKGNPRQQNTHRTQSREGVHSALTRVRQVAERDKDAQFTALLHHVTVDRLRTAYEGINPRAAPGVDGVTWSWYGQDVEARLRDLHSRLHRGAYRAKPSRRVYIPKADGRQRPLGIAALEDKIVQAGVVEVMNAIYESDFLGFSYGFRPRRGAHDALDALATGIRRRKVNWVLDADIRGFFDAISREWMLEFIKHRVGDPRILRLIQKWLAAGVLENGKWARSKSGTPQGATISPLLGNIYLHYAFDLWAHQWRQRNARGEVVIVRYADDFAVGFQYQADAERFLVDLRERFRKFDLELHSDKTRLIEFGRYAVRDRERRGLGKPETFKFLGFVHICSKTKEGWFLLKRQTDGKRMRAKLGQLKSVLLRMRHVAIPVQGAWLQRVVRGYFNYHAVPTNIMALDRFRTEIAHHWRRALRRRSQKSRLDWKRMARLVERWLPHPRNLHPLPEQRFDVRTRGRSPVR